MKKKNLLLTALLGVNLALAAALVFRGHDSTAYAQARGGRALYMTIASHSGGSLVYYVLDTNSGKLAVLRSPDGRQSFAAASAVVTDDLDRAFRR